MSLELLWLLPAVPLLAYLVVTVCMLVLVLYGIAAKRFDVKDAAQSRSFAGLRVPLHARLSGLLIESAFQTLAWTLQLLHVCRMLPEVRGPAGGTPVLVLPGYTENAGTLWWLSRRLAHAGFNVIPLDFPSTFFPLERNKTFLMQRIAQIRAAHGGEDVAVVAHSMGGVITRALALSEPNHGVRVLVAFASPFRGANVAPIGAFLGLGKSVIDLSPGSEFIHTYGPEREAPMPTLSLVAAQETIVTPEWSVVAAGVEVRVFSQAWGHVAPLFLRGPYQCAEAFLLEHGVRRSDGREAEHSR